MTSYFENIKQRSRQILNALLTVGVLSSPAFEVNRPVEPPVAVDVSGMQNDLSNVTWIMTNPHKAGKFTEVCNPKATL